MLIEYKQSFQYFFPATEAPISDPILNENGVLMQPKLVIFGLLSPTVSRAPRPKSVDMVARRNLLFPLEGAVGGSITCVSRPGHLMGTSTLRISLCNFAIITSSAPSRPSPYKMPSLTPMEHATVPRDRLMLMSVDSRPIR